MQLKVRPICSRVTAVPGSTLVSSVGFGLWPKRTSRCVHLGQDLRTGEDAAAFSQVGELLFDSARRKVREGGTPSPTLGTEVAAPGTKGGRPTGEPDVLPEFRLTRR
jgi:hypothetical protein